MHTSTKISLGPPSSCRRLLCIVSTSDVLVAAASCTARTCDRVLRGPCNGNCNSYPPCLCMIEPPRNLHEHDRSAAHMRSFRTAQASHAHLLSDTTCLLNTVRCPEVKKKKKKKKEYAAVNSACPEATHSEWKDAYSYSGEPRSFQLRYTGGSSTTGLCTGARSI